MHIVKLDQYSFQSRENIQPLINQLITQSALLDYYVEIYGIKISSNLIVYKLSLVQNHLFFVVNFFVDSSTNELRFMEFKRYVGNKMENEVKKNNNFKMY